MLFRSIFSPSSHLRVRMIFEAGYFFLSAWPGRSITIWYLWFIRNIRILAIPLSLTYISRSCGTNSPPNKTARAIDPDITAPVAIMIVRSSIQLNLYLANISLITRDGRIWFYDGMAIMNQQLRPALKCVGSILSGLFMFNKT